MKNILRFLNFSLTIGIALALLIIPVYAEENQDIGIISNEGYFSETSSLSYEYDVNFDCSESEKQIGIGTLEQSINKEECCNDVNNEKPNDVTNTNTKEVTDGTSIDFCVDSSVELNDGEEDDDTEQVQVNTVVKQELTPENNVDDNNATPLTLNGWTDTNLGKQYFDNDGLPLTGAQVIEGNLYYFDDNGILQVGCWVVANEKKYFANAEGMLYSNQFISFGSTYYYMGSDGSVQKGIIKASNGKVYYANESTGIIQKKAGWIEKEGKRYFANAEGILYSNQFISFGSTYYYMGSDGSVQKGIIKASNGKIYYANESTGIIQKKAGWIEKEGKRYFANAEGVLYSNQFISFGSTYYYMGSDGSVQKGIVKASNGKLYYANESTGIIQKKAGWIEKEGKRYFCNAEGMLYSNQFISFGSTYYYMGSDGSVQKGIIKASNGKVYYANESTGIIQKKAGWIEKEGKRYFANAEGVLYSNQFISFGGTYYYMGSDGSVQKGIIKASNGKVYYANESTGIIQKKAGWIEKEGKRYFANAEGMLYSNQFISFGSTYYYMGSDGSVQKGIVKASNGKLYYANESTGIIQKKAGWIETNGKRYYVMQGGDLYKNQFIHSIDSNGNKKYYYMGSDCSVMVGTFTINGVTYTTDERGLINEEVVLQGTKGIDVSEFQGIIDWAKVKAAGIKFAFIRVGGRYYGSGGMYNDSYFVTNIRGAIAAGINVGVYYFTQAINNSEALEEALYTLNKISGYNISMPVVIDTESTPNGRHNKISVSTRTNVVKTFCDRIKSAGYTPMIYASTSWLNNQLNMSVLSDYLVWVAQYYHKVTYKGDYKCWQYTSSGKVNGIKGNVDMDYWYGSNDSLITE